MRLGTRQINRARHGELLLAALWPAAAQRLHDLKAR